MRKTKLRERSDMRQCLRAIFHDQHPEAHFYPLLLEHAGEEADSLRIAEIILGAVNAYVGRLAKDMRVNARVVVRFRYGSRLAAALVADQEIAREVQFLWLAGL